MKLLPKLLAGFSALAVLIAAAGIIGIVVSASISGSTDVIIHEKSPIKDVAMEAVISLLESRDAGAEYLLTDSRDDSLKSDIEEYNATFAMYLDMLVHGTGSRTFLDSESGRKYNSADSQISTVAIDGPGLETVRSAQSLHSTYVESLNALTHSHDERLKYNFAYAGKNWDIVHFLTLVELQHKKWVEQLNRQILAGETFTGETDPRKCFFGEWYYAYEIDDPKLNSILSELEPHHNALHESAVQINVSENSQQKSDLYENVTLSRANLIEGLFAEMNEYVEPVLTSLMEQETTIMKTMDDQSLRIEEQLARLEELVNQDLEDSYTESASLQKGGRRLLLITIILGVILALVIGSVIALQISRPLARVTSMAGEIARGNLNFQIDEPKGSSRSEIAQLNDSFKRMLNSLRHKADTIRLFSGGDFSPEVPMESENDDLGNSLSNMSESLNTLLNEVKITARQVATGVDQVSESSQSLSQGATEQASSLEEVTASINNINSQSKQNAGNSREASTLAKSAADGARTGNQQMKEVLEIMEKINTSSDEIKTVVKLIDDIAFQINLLALNANVEAARAGKYGKGFAVVADEVRNLATRSADAVRRTTEMVEGSITNIKEGNSAVKNTAGQLDSIVSAAEKVAAFLEEISAASEEQALAIDEITSGLDQIDQVTQANTASAEESAAASEQLAGQGQMMMKMISEFTLKKDNGSDQRRLPPPEEEKYTP